MFERKLRTLLTLAVLSAVGLVAWPCDAADFSSSDDGGLARLQRTMQVIERQVVTVKIHVAEEFTTLEKLEVRIRDRQGLDTVPRELQEATMRINAMDDELAKSDKRAVAVGDRLAKIRDAAVRQRDKRTIRAVDLMLADLAQLQTNIKIVSEDVKFARDTVARLWDLLG